MKIRLGLQFLPTPFFGVHSSIYIKAICDKTREVKAQGTYAFLLELTGILLKCPHIVHADCSGVFRGIGPWHPLRQKKSVFAIGKKLENMVWPPLCNH